MSVWGDDYWFVCPFCGTPIKKATHEKDWLEGPITCPEPDCGAILDYAKAEKIENLPSGDFYDNGKGFSL